MENKIDGGASLYVLTNFYVLALSVSVVLA